MTYTAENPCTWARKLCVTCSQDINGDVYIRAQTNGMPNHCMKANNTNPIPSNGDFSVKFNKDVSNVLNYDETDVETVE